MMMEGGLFSIDVGGETHRTSGADLLDPKASANSHHMALGVSERQRRD